MLIVTVCAALVRLVRWLPNVRLLGLTPIVGAKPVPEMVTVLGLPAALWAMLILALFAPVEAGVNVTLTVQLAFGASEALQVVVRANWLASVPPTVIALDPPPVNTRSAVPELLIVTVCAALATLVR